MSKLRLKPQFLIDETGKKRSVLLSVRDYESIIKKLEEWEDTILADEAMEREHDFVPFDEFKKELKKAGKL
ncbi:MAG: hypothetical protein HRF49_01585 [bacterium]|jgi:predicted DNA-binding protein